MAGSVEDVHADGGTEANSEELSHLRHDVSLDSDMPDASAIFATPQQALHDFAIPSGQLTRSYPNTRSRAKQDIAGSEGSSRSTPLFSRLQSASTVPAKKESSLRLEDSRDVQYLQDEADEENDADDVVAASQNLREPSMGRQRPETGQLRVTRRSARIRSRQTGRVGGTAIRKKGSSLPKRLVKRQPKPKQERIPAYLLRRSLRLAKPPTNFLKYLDLPLELGLMVWEAAITPRLVYIRNRAAPSYNALIQNEQPNWFNTCYESQVVANKAYRLMFGLHSPDNPLTAQYVNPDVDIVAFEPCCNGCRGQHCARHQFRDMDRFAVRFLAVQTDSPFLIPIAKPCWETISVSFPNVEILYLMKSALKGDKKEEKALIRIEEGSRETELRKKFDHWKKGAGSNLPLAELEFVVVVNKEAETKDSRQKGDRYTSIAERKTGLPEDIILG